MADQSYKQWPFFDDAHRELAQDIDSWAISELSWLSDAGHDDVDSICKKLVKQLGDGGWLRNSVPAVAGGNYPQLDVRSLCLSRQNLAYHSGLADFAFAMQGLGSGPISLFADPVIQQRYLPGVAKGDLIAAFALSEPDAGSDVAAMITEAVVDGDDYILNGCKTWISNGGIADFYTVFARTNEGPGAKGISCFVVDADTPGFSITDRIDVIAPHPLATLAFEECRIPKSQMIGQPGKGFGIAMATLDVFRSTVGAAALGFARRALDEAGKHTTQRKIFGGKLSDLAITQSSLGEMALDIDTSALLIYRSAWTKDTIGSRVTREAAMAKFYATEAAQRVIDQALQLHGGLGVVSGNMVESLYREIRALRIYEGASEVQKVIMGQQALREFSS
ncbi:MAG: acyl-CoA dehydrogenase [Dinoroseobacter sp.]